MLVTTQWPLKRAATSPHLSGFVFYGCLESLTELSALWSTVLDRFFPYLIQMITSMRRCVACDDLWPWPISSRSFDLEFENRVRSVTFSVLDRLFPYLPQIITTIRGCVACYVYKKNPKFQFFTNFSNFLAFTLKKNLQFCLHSFHIWHKSSLSSEDVSHVMTFDLDRYFQGHSALTLKIVSTL